MPSADFFWSTHDETDTDRSIARARNRHRGLAARSGAAGDLERAPGAQGDAADAAADARARLAFRRIGIDVRRVDAGADDAAVDSEFGVARIGDGARDARRVLRFRVPVLRPL